MICLKTEKTAIIIVLITIYSINWANLSEAMPIMQEESSIEIAFESKLNLSQIEKPFPFHGWVNFTEYVVRPVTIHLDPYSDIGEVYLSQYDFTFQTPDSIPFDGIICIEPENITLPTPTLTITGYYEQGMWRTSINSISYIIPCTYYNENETEKNETVEGFIKQGGEDVNPYLIGIPILAVVSGIAAVLVKRRIKEG